MNPLKCGEDFKVGGAAHLRKVLIGLSPLSPLLELGGGCQGLLEKNAPSFGASPYKQRQWVPVTSTDSAH